MSFLGSQERAPKAAPPSRYRVQSNVPHATIFPRLKGDRAAGRPDLDGFIVESFELRDFPPAYFEELEACEREGRRPGLLKGFKTWIENRNHSPAMRKMMRTPDAPALEIIDEGDSRYKNRAGIVPPQSLIEYSPDLAAMVVGIEDDIDALQRWERQPGSSDLKALIRVRLKQLGADK